MFSSNRLKLLALFASLCAINSCGGDAGELYRTGGLKADIVRAKTFNPTISHGQIVQYRITITAEDISEPIVATFDGEANAGIIEDIPIGDNRHILVEAINANGYNVREGEQDSIKIFPGQLAQTAVQLESVPAFANLINGSVVSNTRFAIQVFSDEAWPFEIKDEYSGLVVPLLDTVTGEDKIVPDISTGIAKYVPPLLAAGEHKLTIKNDHTGRATTINIHLTDGTKLKAAPLLGNWGLFRGSKEPL